MGRYRTAAKAWVAWLTLGAAVATILAGDPRATTPHDWLAFCVIATCAATAHLFPARSAFGGATFTLTIVFLLAGAVTLPAPLLTLLAIAALTPERWMRRGKPGLLIGWFFNVSQTALAIHAAGLVARWAGVSSVGTVQELLGLLAAGVVFTLTQALLVGVIISIQAQVPLFNSDTLTITALLSDGLLALIGVIIGGLWLTTPILLLLWPPLLIIVLRMTRTAHLAHLAQIDVKTGLHNYRHFESALEDELARSQRVGRPLAVLFADLDHFKQVNDKHGHAVGDRVLLETSNLISSALRKTDLVARFGGEEFVALLPGTDTDEALYLAERVRAAVEAHSFTIDEHGRTLRVTISVGVASCPDDAADPITLMKLADEAVYQAKRTRNAVARPTAALARSNPPPERATVQPHDLGLPRQATAIIAACALGGLAFAAHAIWSVQGSNAWAQLAPFVLLSLAAELLGVKVYEAGRDRIMFSFGAAATMVAVTAAPEAAPLVSLISASAHVVLVSGRTLPRVAFNLGNPPLAAGVAALVYGALRPSGAEFGIGNLAAALASAATYYVFNSMCLSRLISLTTRRSWLVVLRESGWSTPINLLLGLTGAFLGGAHEQLGLIGTLMFAAPILILRVTLDFYARRSQHAIAVLQDVNGQLQTEIGERKRFQASLEHQALHDPLTDFPNRAWLLAEMQRRSAAGESFALLLLDVDRFKEINDTFGHQCGDSILRAVGFRLQQRLRTDDTIARLGGDEFGVLVCSAGHEDALRVARELLHLLEQPFGVEDQTLEVSASIGVALSPVHGVESDVLLRRADVAMYVAKRDQSHVALYDPLRDQHSPARLRLATDLRRAIERGELVLNYQPTASFRTGGVIGAEALVRWAHPEQGLVPPDQFIPLAEHTGLIRPLTRWVLEAAVRQARDWQLGGLDLCMSVNLSMRDLHDPQLPSLVSKLLERYGVDASRLRLEITESAVMADAERAISVLSALRELGVHVAVDDFGTGYSSLAYLKRLPVDELKIDRSFVHQLASDAQDLAIVRSTIALAHDLGLSVVAEGVEDAAAWEMLRRQGCDVAQGYYLSKPLSADAFAAWLHEFSQRLHAA